MANYSSIIAYPFFTNSRVERNLRHGNHYLFSSIIAHRTRVYHLLFVRSYRAYTQVSKDARKREKHAFYTVLQRLAFLLSLFFF